MSTDAAANNPFEQWIDLAQARLGGNAIYATDDFFADRQRMLQPHPAVFIDGKYDDHGKWMDGWESRRKRGTGHDHCIVRLGLAGVLHGVDIDTSHFTGNYPPAASLDACHCPDGDPDGQTVWSEVLPSVSLQGNRHHFHAIESAATFTHVRLNIYPDGGVARLRVYGEPQRSWDAADTDTVIDLFAVENGGRAIVANDQHFGRISNLNLPGRGINMGDGWETRRRREPGNDWVIVRLGCPGIVERIVVDTAHYKGNYPDRCSIQAAMVDGGTDRSLVSQSLYWPELLAPQKLQMDAEHEFADALARPGAVSHLRLNIHPDGGISRLRVYGRPLPDTGS